MPTMRLSAYPGAPKQFSLLAFRWAIFVTPLLGFRGPDFLDDVVERNVRNPPVPQNGSATVSCGPGSSMWTAIRQMLRGVKNSPRSPRRLEPTISSYAFPLTSMLVSSNE